MLSVFLCARCATLRREKRTKGSMLPYTEACGQRNKVVCRRFGIDAAPLSPDGVAHLLPVLEQTG